MKRGECFRVLARHVKDEVVVSTYSSAFEWLAIADRPLNHNSHGAMGLASSHGLGLALGLPHRRVIVLDGDGSLLMNLGTLVTIAGAKPKNLVHFVCQNSTYEANGGHPIPNPELDFMGIARSAGIANCYSFSDIAAFEAQIEAVLYAEGPVFAVLKIEEGHIERHDYEDLYKPERRQALRDALASGR
jgi:thiamine pyrophosphate-dependent acetolactate synthase large subunit-like protein